MRRVNLNKRTQKQTQSQRCKALVEFARSWSSNSKPRTSKTATENAVEDLTADSVVLRAGKQWRPSKVVGCRPIVKR